MSTFYLNQAPSMYIVGKQDDVSFSYPALFTSTLHDQKIDDHHFQAQRIQQMPAGYWLMNGSRHEDTGESSSSLKLSLGDQTPSMPSKWMSSKMRFMKKMMNSNDDHPVALSKPGRKHELESQDHRQRKLQQFCAGNSNEIVRVCSDCHTTKTPLWRSGPQGPKSLCNACGIRQRKARRAMAAAAVAENGEMIMNVEAPVKVRKERNLVADCNLPIKKRCKIASATYAPRFEDTETPINLSVNSTLQKVFPQDERDAAILLMALSYGFVRS